MHDRSDSRGDRDGSREGPRDDRSRDDSSRGDGGGPRRDGSGPDTRFLQLELSQVMYAEAEAVTRPAFRELLREAAKERLRERFGEKITALANLAVDELLDGAQASFEIEARIQQQGEQRRPASEQLRELFAGGLAGGESRQAGAGKRPRGTSARKRKR